jgi:hypothetical protein
MYTLVLFIVFSHLLLAMLMYEVINDVRTEIHNVIIVGEDEVFGYLE